MLTEHDIRRLDALYAALEQATERFLGYPVSKDFEMAPLERFLRFPMNNLGDPFVESTFAVGTRGFECEVVDFVADLLRARAGETWGYVTNGGTEGNLYGLYLARELLPNGVVYFSEDMHYSVVKNIHFLGLRSIMIRSQPNGEIDYEDLAETLRINRDKPAILFANVGTTMTEARDDIVKIRDILDQFAIRDRYIHSDAALCGGFAPFLEPRPAFDFADGADSVSISGHKFFGSPMPCGIVIARKRHVERIARSIGYIGSLDTTITGSRNGFTPLVLWYRIKELGVEGLRRRAASALELATYAEERMKAAGIAAWRNPQALTVVFPKVSDAIKARWQLATQEQQSHLIVMPNVTRAQIDALVDDMVAERREHCSADSTSISHLSEKSGQA
ncbi:histidine decarboxylase [Paraburkholderia humisilvae]|uniref:Histidine decarboxylase n=1 Tax=Paraburkholderia humisilvae TaxID=627669 RepID=A0A6J5F647_9BURK|nr:histidine decarboxylase [Paraburkholderia humisilvae]CAB3774004.1 Histidine decarboxylase [Paraburkholderia humisilvae]